MLNRIWKMQKVIKKESKDHNMLMEGKAESKENIFKLLTPDFEFCFFHCLCVSMKITLEFET